MDVLHIQLRRAAQSGLVKSNWIVDLKRTKLRAPSWYPTQQLAQEDRRQRRCAPRRASPEWAAAFQFLRGLCSSLKLMTRATRRIRRAGWMWMRRDRTRLTIDGSHLPAAFSKRVYIFSTGIVKRLLDENSSESSCFTNPISSSWTRNYQVFSFFSRLPSITTRPNRRLRPVAPPWMSARLFSHSF